MTGHLSVSAKDSRRIDRGATSAPDEKVGFDSFTHAASTSLKSDLCRSEFSGHAAPEPESDLHTLQKKCSRTQRERPPHGSDFALSDLRASEPIFAKRSRQGPRYRL